jgi:ABC-type antimicrobial peptide transport system permease subunit
LINQAFAERRWPGGSPVGQVLVVDGVLRLVAGVVRDGQLSGMGPVPPTVFLPMEESPTAVQVFGVPNAIANATMAVVQQMEPRALITTDRLSDLLYSSFSGLRTAARLLAALGLLALLLAAAGVSGTVSYIVEQRRREIGIRMALGARPWQALAALLSGNARACGAGLAVGVLLAMVASRGFTSQMYGVKPVDPITYGGALSLMILVGAAASVLPAIRTVREDASTVLRGQ